MKGSQIFLLLALIVAIILIVVLPKKGDRIQNNTQTTTTDAGVNEPMSILEAAASTGAFNTFVQAASLAGISESLTNEGPFTIFMPTDEAFAALPAETLEKLGNDPAMLRDILLYHVVTGTVPASQVATSTELTMANGDKATIVAADGKVTIDGATILEADVQVSNGIIHVIDTVMMPPTTATSSPAKA